MGYFSEFPTFGVGPLTEPQARLIAALADRYTIERELGAGGMATVYLAEDLKHQRKVAIKVLRQELSATLGSERFAREIAVAARLQHPHILGLLDSGEAGDFFYYVMPYVDGETLRDRLTRGGELPVHEAVRLLGEITDALAAAHKGGVVHRDIKPENILLSGRHAMVMDFGVAKAVTESTGAHQLTSIGVALGTPAYMAPEQATADPHMDGRVDIYALGVLAYEMLTGQPPFHGLNPQQTLAAHVTQAPTPLGQRRPGLSLMLEAVVMRCLAKRPADRFQTADELVTALEPLTTPSGGTTPHGTMPYQTAVAPVGRRRLWLGVGGVVVVAAIAWAGWRMTASRPLDIRTANIRQVTRDPSLEIHVAISPDGGQVAYQQGPSLGLSKVMVRDIAGGSAIALTADWDGAQFAPAWMPDGRHLIINNFIATADHGAGQWKVPRLGGQAVAMDSVDWLDARRGSVVVVDSVARQVRLVTPAGVERMAWPATGQEHSEVLGRDGRMAFVRGNIDGQQSIVGNVAPSSIWVGVPGHPIRMVTDSTSMNLSPQWLPDGTLLYVSTKDGARDIYALRIDAAGLPRGEAVRLTTGLSAYSISVSADGRTLAYDRFTLRRNIYAIDLSGGAPVSVRTARAITTGNQTIETLDVSADGRVLVFDSNLEGNHDIYLMSTGGGEPRRITRDPGDDFSPDLSADGTEIAFHSTRGTTRDIYRIGVDGAGEQRLTDDAGQSFHPAWSPDGLAMTFNNTGPDSMAGIFLLRRPTTTAPWGAAERIGRRGTFAARWSPDGSQLVYDVRPNGPGPDSWLELLRPGEAPRRLAIDPAVGLRRMFWPEWSEDGTAIYFFAVNSDREQGLYRVPATGGVPRLLVRFDDPAMLPFTAAVAVAKGVGYFSIGELESDIYVMDLVWQ